MMHRTHDRVVCHGLTIVVIAMASYARGDAIVVTQAMRASTIAEVFINDNELLVEIEIGTEDVGAFANVLPDELHEKVMGKSSPIRTRIATFFESDWVWSADGQLLAGELQRVVPAKRIVRVEVTGEPIPEQPDDAEHVVRVTLRYPLPDRPSVLTIRVPRVDSGLTANVGFVCYHQGLPVNEFRYLPQQATLDLDWDDPWYSRFRHPNLRRQNDSPMSAYLYIEPYEVRQEIIIRPQDLQHWIDLGLPDSGIIRAERQEELKKRVAEFLSGKNQVAIDGRLAEGRLDVIHFVHRTLRTTGVIDPPVDLDSSSATLGVIFVYPIDQLPIEVSMKWELFNPKIERIPAVASDEAGGFPGEVSAADPVLVWRNHLTNPTSPKMMTVVRPPSRRQFSVPLISVLSGTVAVTLIAALAWRLSIGEGVSRFALAAAIVALIGAAVSFPWVSVTIADPFEEPSVLQDQEVENILSSLLHNVYRAFDRHDDHLVYDRLAQSISGELLSDVYLETRKSMEVKNQGGLRISVKEVLVTELESLDGKAAEPTFRCRWQVSGWIGHWGHVHRRQNEHVANITIAVRDELWKITDMEMLDEHAVAEGQRGASR